MPIRPECLTAARQEWQETGNIAQSDIRTSQSLARRARHGHRALVRGWARSWRRLGAWICRARTRFECLNAFAEQRDEQQRPEAAVVRRGSGRHGQGASSVVADAVAALRRGVIGYHKSNSSNPHCAAQKPQQPAKKLGQDITKFFGKQQEVREGAGSLCRCAA